MGTIGVPELMVMLLTSLVTGLLFLLPAWKILNKAGFTPFWSLLVLLPLANLVLLYFVAFARWPALGSREGT